MQADFEIVSEAVWDEETTGDVMKDAVQIAMLEATQDGMVGEIKVDKDSIQVSKASKTQGKRKIELNVTVLNRKEFGMNLWVLFWKD